MKKNIINKILIFTSLVFVFGLISSCESSAKTATPNDTQLLEEALKTENFTSYSIEHNFRYNQNASYYKTVVNNLNYQFEEYNYNYNTLINSVIYIKSGDNYNYFSFDNSINNQNFLFGYCQTDLSAINFELKNSSYLNLENNIKSYNVFNYSLLNADMFSYAGDGIYEVKQEYKTQLLSIFFEDETVYNYIEIKVKVENNKLTELHITRTETYTGEYHFYFTYDNIEVFLKDWKDRMMKILIYSILDI